jgi:hypothetical protein
LASKKQTWEVIELINSYNPQDLCVITESSEIVRGKLDAVRHDGDFSMTNQIAAVCENKKIETHKVDFRKIHAADTKKIVSIRSEPEKVTVTEFANIISQQVDRIDKVDHKIIPENQRKLTTKLIELCSSSAFVNEKADSLFNYCATLLPTDELFRSKIDDFIWSLIDARIIAATRATQKKVIIIVAGLDHINAVRSREQTENNYQSIWELREVKDITTLAELAINKSPTIITASILELDVKKFWKDAQTSAEILKKIELISRPNNKDIDEKKVETVPVSAGSGASNDSKASKKLKF